MRVHFAPGSFIDYTPVKNSSIHFCFRQYYLGQNFFIGRVVSITVEEVFTALYICEDQIYKTDH